MNIQTKIKTEDAQAQQANRIQLNGNEPISNSLITETPSAIKLISADSQQRQFSGFITDKVDERPNACFHEEEILDHIRTTKPQTSRKARWINNAPSKAYRSGYLQAVTWSGKFDPNRSQENLVHFSGYICFGFHNLSPERLTELRSELKNDPYSRIVFDHKLDAGLKVIINSDCNSQQDYQTYFIHLSDYYRSTYNVSAEEINGDGKDISQLCYLPYDPDLHHNPASKSFCLNAFKASDDTVKGYSESLSSEVELQKSETENTQVSEVTKLETITNSIATRIEKTDEQLRELLQTEQRIIDAASQPIVFKPPLLSRLNVPIIRNGTINIIQGKQGQHKSRLAEMIVSLLIAKENYTTDFLGFERLVQSVMVCYLDTERNIDEECAHSLQSIRRNAGYDFNEEVTNLRFLSLKQEERTKRLAVIDQFLNQVRQSTSLPLFVVLDVVTDCIGSFNNDREAMQLFDSIHRLCERHQSTFLLVIHENPTSEKARGHVGTEAGNKASTVLQISVEDSEATSPLIKLRYIKLRADKLPDPVYLQMDDQTKRLMLADETHIKTHVKSLKQKIDFEQLAETVLQLLADGPLPKGKLCKEVMEHFGAGDSLVRRKLTGLMTDQRPMIDQNGQQVVLAESGNGRDYFLQPID